jgi:hypothetical protein
LPTESAVSRQDGRASAVACAFVPLELFVERAEEKEGDREAAGRRQELFHEATLVGRSGDRGWANRRTG